MIPKQIHLGCCLWNFPAFSQGENNSNGEQQARSTKNLHWKENFLVQSPSGSRWEEKRNTTVKQASGPGLCVCMPLATLFARIDKQNIFISLLAHHRPTVVHPANLYQNPDSEKQSVVLGRGWKTKKALKIWEKKNIHHGPTPPTMGSLTFHPSIPSMIMARYLGGYHKGRGNSIGFAVVPSDDGLCFPAGECLPKLAFVGYQNGPVSSSDAAC